MPAEKIVDGVRIVRWAHGSEGVGHIASGPLEGRVLFVPGAVPGDRVDVRLTRVKKRWARGTLHRLLEASEHRVEPSCPVQARCGGCPWMRGDAEVQRASRLAILEGELRKHLGARVEGATVELATESPEGGEERLGYRVRLRLRYERLAGVLQLGFRARGGHGLVPIARCDVAAEPLNAALPSLRARLEAEGARAGEVLVLSGEEGVGALIREAGGRPWRWGGGSDEGGALSVRHGASSLLARPESFVQAHATGFAALSAEVRDAASEVPSGHAVELFAGVGTLTLPLLDAGHRVTAYEGEGGAAELFEANVRGRGRARLHLGDLSTGTPEPGPARADLILLDPPRSGALALAPWIRASGARRVILVSCDVATGARDLAALTERSAGPEGRLLLRSARGFDLFPHTGHQELLAVLDRERG